MFKKKKRDIGLWLSDKFLSLRLKISSTILAIIILIFIYSNHNIFKEKKIIMMFEEPKGMRNRLLVLQEFSLIFY